MGQKEGNGVIHMGFCALGQASLEALDIRNWVHLTKGKDT